MVRFTTILLVRASHGIRVHIHVRLVDIATSTNEAAEGEEYCKTLDVELACTVSLFCSFAQVNKSITV